MTDIPKNAEASVVKKAASDTYPLFDEKSSAEMRKLIPQMRQHFMQFLEDGVQKSVILSDANKIVRVMTQSLDRADGKGDGKITKDTLRQVVRVLDANLFANLPPSKGIEFRKVAEASIEHLLSVGEALSVKDAQAFLEGQISKHLNKVAGVIDANKDNVLSAAEAILSVADKNKNGSVSLFEAISAVEQSKVEIQKSDIAKMFYKFDTNHDFSLSLKEIQAVLKNVTKPQQAKEIELMPGPSLKGASPSPIPR